MLPGTTSTLLCYISSWATNYGGTTMVGEIAMAPLPVVPPLEVAALGKELVTALANCSLCSYFYCAWTKEPLYWRIWFIFFEKALSKNWQFRAVLLLLSWFEKQNKPKQLLLIWKPCRVSRLKKHSCVRHNLLLIINIQDVWKVLKLSLRSISLALSD